MSHRLHPIGVALALALSAATASAQIFSGADIGGGVGDPRINSNAAHGAWAAAAAPLCAPTETFEGFALGAATPLALACGMTLTSNGPVGAGFSLNQVTNDQTAEIGYNTTLGGERFFRFAPDFGVPATLTISFASPVRAFGAYVTGVQAWAGPTVATWGGNAFTLVDTDPNQARVAGVQFFGFVSAVPIASIDFTTTPNAAIGFRDIMGFDDLQVSAIPEPGTVALTVTGLLALGGVAARRRRA